MWRCWLLIRRTNPSWYSASLHWAAELKIPYILSPDYLAVMKIWGCFFKPCVEEEVDDENLWGQLQVPVSWLNLHVLMTSARICMAPHHWQKLSTATSSQPLMGFSLQCCVGMQPPSHWIRVTKLCFQIVSIYVVALSNLFWWSC